jgi:hypothetical protein
LRQLPPILVRVNSRYSRKSILIFLFVSAAVGIYEMAWTGKGGKANLLSGECGPAFAKATAGKVRLAGTLAPPAAPGAKGEMSGLKKRTDCFQSVRRVII